MRDMIGWVAWCVNPRWAAWLSRTWPKERRGVSVAVGERMGS